jgi:hypothetical protein
MGNRLSVMDNRAVEQAWTTCPSAFLLPADCRWSAEPAKFFQNSWKDEWTTVPLDARPARTLCEGDWNRVDQG